MRYQGLPGRGLLVNGPHIPVRIADISHVALLDTGARHSYIDEDLLLDLGLEATGLANATGATGSEQRPTFNVNFTVPGLGLTVPTPVRSLALTRNEHYWIAIIGRDILNHCELTINWQTETISIERLPGTG
jgi:hypothetical protein